MRYRKDNRPSPSIIKQCLTSPFLPSVFTTPSFVSGEATSSAGNPRKEQKLFVIPQLLGLRRKSFTILLSIATSQAILKNSNKVNVSQSWVRKAIPCLTKLVGQIQGQVVHTRVPYRTCSNLVFRQDTLSTWCSTGIVVGAYKGL